MRHRPFHPSIRPCYHAGFPIFEEKNMSFAPGWRGTNTIAQENDQMMRQVPRRSRMDLWTPAEKAIHDAMQEVEKMEADVRLTNAVLKLSEAQRLVADFIDGINPL